MKQPLDMNVWGLKKRSGLEASEATSIWILLEVWVGMRSLRESAVMGAEGQAAFQGVRQHSPLPQPDLHPQQTCLQRVQQQA